MTDIVRVPNSIEILPPDQVAAFREDLATMEKLHRDLEPVFEEARKLRDLKTWDKPTRARAGELVNEYKRAVKDAADTIERWKKVVNRFKEEYILQPERRVANRAEEIKGILTPKMAEWDRLEQEAAEAERKAEARKKQEELNRQAELRRQEDERLAKELREKRVEEIRADLKAGKFGDPKTAKAKRQAQKLLEQAGATEEAHKVAAAAAEQEAKEKAAQVAATVKVGTNIPSVPGNRRTITFSADCTDKTGFLLAMVAAKVRNDVLTFGRLAAVIDVSSARLSSEAKDHIKTSPDDARHDLTREEFEKLYPFVQVKENRGY